MKIGIIKEGKNPPDKRVPLSPQQCKYISQNYPSVSLYVQSSEIRCFSDEEYIENGIDIVSDLSFCDIILGVKEVPVEMLLENKVFFFFSHTIKKQPYNQELLKQIIAKKIQLIDYETLVCHNLKRVIGFGRYAGIVGAYNTFLTHGLKTKKYTLPYAHTLDGKIQLDAQLLNVKLPSTVKVAPSKVKLDSTVASSESLKVRTPFAVEPSNDIPPPPPPPVVSISSCKSSSVI